MRCASSTPARNSSASAGGTRNRFTTITPPAYDVRPSRLVEPVETSKSSCSLRCLGFSGWFGAVDWSGSSQIVLSRIAEGTPRWYSSEESDENPSSPISSS